MNEWMNELYAAPMILDLSQFLIPWVQLQYMSVES